MKNKMIDLKIEYFYLSFFYRAGINIGWIKLNSKLLECLIASRKVVLTRLFWER